MLYPIGMWNLNHKQTTYGLGLVASIFVFVLLAHLTVIQVVMGGFLKVNATSSPAFITRMIDSALQIEVTPIPVIPPKIKPRPKHQPTLKAPKQESLNQTVETKTTDSRLSLATQPMAQQSETPTNSPTDSVIEQAEAEPTQLVPPTAVASSEAVATAFNAPPSTRLVYGVDFTRNGYINYGNAVLDWQHDGGSYKLSLVASYFGIDMFEQQSQGLINLTGLQPIRFADKRFRKSEVATHFNHQLEKITFSSNTSEVPLLAGAQDRLSVIPQLAGLLAAEPLRYATGSSVTMQVANDKLAEPWVFNVEHLETLNLEHGPTIARKLTRNPRREFDQKVELWFASEQNHALVRFRFTETKGDYIDAKLKNTLTTKMEN